jgi:hypothetical protein
MADYVSELEAKLKSTRQRLKQSREMKHLKAAAPTLFEIIDSEISLAVNRAFGDKPLEYDAYLSAHGEAKGMRRIRDLINSKEADEAQAVQEAKGIQDNLKQIRNDQK